MRVTLLAVGRLRRGPERELVDGYLTRFAKAGRPLGLPPASLVEVEGRPSEAEALTRAIPAGAALAVLDERGAQMTSPDFADLLADHRDQARDLCLVLGGADGLDPAIRDRADHAIAFGRMVWPHMLARVMLAEQLYRAASILGAAPYHRA